MNRYLAKLRSLDEKRAYPSNPQNPQNPQKRGFEGFEGSPTSAFLPLATPSTEVPETAELRAGAKAIAGREMVAGVHDNTQTEHDTGPYASALAALRAQCPAYVDPADWQRVTEDGRRFIAQWGAGRSSRLDLRRLVRLAQPARKACAQLPTTVPLRPDGACLVLAISRGGGADDNGGNTPLSERRDPEVLQAQRASIGGDRQRGTGRSDWRGT